VLCKHEVVGSNPSGSTILLRPSGFAGQVQCKSSEASAKEEAIAENMFPSGSGRGGKSDIVN
jgi:hypothetical protein